LSPADATGHKPDPVPPGRGRLLENAQRLRSIRTRRSLLPPPAGGRGDPAWEASWRHLFEVYAPAMRRYVGALLGAMAPGVATADDAADIVQEYLTTSLEKGWLARDGAQIRCFRAYLQVQLKRFTWAWVRGRLTQKRHPPNAPTDFGLEEAPAAADDAAGALDAAVVETLVEDCLRRLRTGNELYAEIIADLLRTDGAGSPDLASRLGRPPADLPVLRYRARRRFAHLFTERLREAVRDPEDYDALLARLEPYLP